MFCYDQIMCRKFHGEIGMDDAVWMSAKFIFPLGKFQ